MNESSASIDKFGFFSTSTSLQQCDLLQSCARIEKWETMLSDWEHFSKNRSGTLKTRIRKGIPSSIRGRVWCLLADIDILQQGYPKNYYSHLQSLELDRQVETDIVNDLNRTFPNHIKFSQKTGQLALFRVLRSYAVIDPEVSYTQGMSFIVGMFLLFLDEEQAFWLLVALLTQYEFRNFFIHGMPKLYSCFYVANGLLRHYVPSVYKKFKKEAISSPMYSTQWFLTGFTSFLNIECTLRIWDCFWNEGFKVFYRVYLAIIVNERKYLSERSFEKILQRFSTLADELQSEKLIKAAFKISLKSKLIQRLEQDYINAPKPKYIDWVVFKLK